MFIMLTTYDDVIINIFSKIMQGFLFIYKWINIIGKKYTLFY